MCPTSYIYCVFVLQRLLEMKISSAVKNDPFYGFKIFDFFHYFVLNEIQ